MSESKEDNMQALIYGQEENSTSETGMNQQAALVSLTGDETDEELDQIAAEMLSALGL